MTEQISYIPARLKNAAVNGHVAGAEDIIDDVLNRTQNDINEEVAAVPYNVSSPNGMGKVVLKKNDNFKQVVEAQTSGNTIFVIKYDFILTGDVTVPANCVLEFDGGALYGNYSINNIGIYTFKGNVNIQCPIGSIIHSTKDYSSKLSGYGCYTIPLNGNYNFIKGIYDLGMSYVIYYTNGAGRSEMVLSDIRLLSMFGIAVILHLPMTNDDTTGIATDEEIEYLANYYKDEPNIVGWYTFDEPDLKNISVATQQQRIDVLKSVKNIPCYVCYNADDQGGYISKICYNHDYVLISQYYNYTGDREIKSNTDINSTYGQVLGFSAFGIDKLIPIYETYGDNLTDSKALNNLLLKKSLFKNNGVFFIYYASTTVVGFYNSIQGRQLVKNVMNTPTSRGNLILKGCGVAQNNRAFLLEDFVKEDSRVSFDYIANNEKGINISQNHGYLLINFGREVNCGRLCLQLLFNTGIGSTFTFDYGIPIDLKKKEMIKLGSLNVQIASNGIGSGSAAFNDICTDKIIIKLENAESVNHWHHIVALTSVGITYKNIEMDATVIQDIVSYGIKSEYETQNRPSLNAEDSGLQIFDLTLKKPIWWNGTAWVDATGQIV